LVTVAGCGSTASGTARHATSSTTHLDQSGTAYLENLVRRSLDGHRLDVQSVSCPAGSEPKGTVVHCAVTLRAGHRLTVTATALDGLGAFRVIASEMLADNVERGIVETLAQRGVKASATCPEHIRVVVGRMFGCRVSYARGDHATATVTIVDADGGFRLSFREPA
jgi:Domain of unknown function (DUF4333)